MYHPSIEVPLTMVAQQIEPLETRVCRAKDRPLHLANHLSPFLNAPLDQDRMAHIESFHSFHGEIDFHLICSQLKNI